MARSVSTPGDAVYVAYQAFECEDDDFASDDFSDGIDNLRYALKAAFPSTYDADWWSGRENHIVAENDFAAFGVSEYCGLVAIWVVPKPQDGATNGLRNRWLSSIQQKFRTAVAGCFGVDLLRTGVASNGEAFFQPMDGRQRGEMGLGYTSKEQWL